MAGQASGGQKLTSNPNVTAPAGSGFDNWGANGGGITPVGNNVSGQTGYDNPIANTTAIGETATNYNTTTNSLLAQLSTGAVSAAKFDDALPGGGSNAG